MVERQREGPRLNQGAEDRERQNWVSDLDPIIEPLGQWPLRAEAAAPFAVVVSDSPELPLGQFKIEQGQCRIGPGLGLKQSVNSLCPGEMRCRRIALAQKLEHVRHERGRNRLRAAKLRLKRTNSLILVCNEQHGTTAGEGQLAATTLENWVNSH